MKSELLFLFTTINTRQILETTTLRNLFVEIVKSDYLPLRDLLETLDVLFPIANKKSFDPVNEANKISEQAQLYFLFFETLIYNLDQHVNSKINVAEDQEGIMNLDDTKKELLLDFLKDFVTPIAIFKNIRSTIHQDLDFKHKTRIGNSIRALILLLDKIFEREDGLNPKDLDQLKKDFESLLEFADIKNPIKADFLSINSVIFSGNMSKITRILSLKNNKLQTHIGLTRIWKYYFKALPKNKYFTENLYTGDQILRQLVFSYLETKKNFDVTTCFLDPRDDEPVVDYILNYLALNFLIVPMDFENYYSKNLSSYEKTEKLEFCKQMQGDRLKKAFLLLENLPEDFKSFLRDIQSLVDRVQFQDGTPLDYPVKNLFLRFLIGPNLQGARGMFREFFFPYASNIVKSNDETRMVEDLHEKFNHAYNQIVMGDDKPVDNVIFNISKSLLKHDYRLVKDAMEEISTSHMLEINFFYEAALKSRYEIDLERRVDELRRMVQERDMEIMNLRIQLDQKKLKLDDD